MTALAFGISSLGLGLGSINLVVVSNKLNKYPAGPRMLVSWSQPER